MEDGADDGLGPIADESENTDTSGLMDSDNTTVEGDNITDDGITVNEDHISLEDENFDDSSSQENQNESFIQ